MRATLLPLVLRRDGRQSALRHWKLFRQSQYWSRQQLLDFQQQCLTQLLTHACETSPYYTRVFDDHGITPGDIKSFEDLQKLPILTRDNVYDCVEDLRSRRFEASRLLRTTTGGSTGVKAPLYRDRECWNAKLALEWRNESWMGRLPCDRMALIWPAAMDVEPNQSALERCKDRYVLRRVLYCAGSQDESELARVYAELRQYRPHFLKVFPSNLQILAAYMKAARKSLPGIRGIQTTGEPMLANQHELFREVFDCPVFDMYGSREVGNTSCECNRHEGLHVAMESTIIEFVKDGKQVPVGEEGEILVTDLYNYGMPMIRYQINDYGRQLATSCSCGRELVLMSPGVGRVTDDIFAADGTRVSGQVMGVYLVDENPGVGQLQIVQKSLTEHIVRITNKPVPSRQDFSYIETQMRRLLGDSIRIEFEVLDAIPREASGKVRFVKSEIQPS